MDDAEKKAWLYESIADPEYVKRVDAAIESLKAELEAARASLANWKQVAFEADQAKGCLQDERDEARQAAEQAAERQRELVELIHDFIEALQCCEDFNRTDRNLIEHANAILAQAEGKK